MPFQLDQNINDKRLAELCNAEVPGRVLRFPVRLQDEPDEIVLPDLLGGDATFVTTDHRIVDENPSSVPSNNPGLVVIHLKVASRTMTAQLATDMIARFKEAFPTWAEVDWSQLYLEITEEDVYLAPLRHGDVTGGREIRFNSASFSATLQEAIESLRTSSLSGI